MMSILDLYAVTNYFQPYFTPTVLVLVLVILIQTKINLLLVSDYDKRITVVEEDIKKEFETRLADIQESIGRDSQARMITMIEDFKEYVAVEAARTAVIAAAGGAGSSAPFSAMLMRARWAAAVLAAHAESDPSDFAEIRKCAKRAAVSWKNGRRSH
jgi:hypothetical protein